MKRASLFIVWLLLTIILLSCKDDDPAAINSQVVFNLTVSSSMSGRLSSDFSGTSVKVSLESSAGVSVFSRKTIPLLAFGSDYISEPLELPPGDYVITEFVVVRDSSAIEFVTPITGSKFARIVKHPLPVPLHVSNGKSSTVDMEVVSVDANEPEDFGYVGFKVTEVKPLMISVFNNSNNSLTLTNAKAYLIHEDDTVSSYSITPTSNVFPFKADVNTSYTLTIWKDGFTHFSRTIVYNDLIQELDGEALKVYLKPALTLEVLYDSDVYFEFSLDVTATGKYDVDWGDGTLESITISPGDEFGGTYLAHYYTGGAERYHVEMTGDLSKIYMIDGAPPWGYVFRTMDVSSVKNLTSIDLFWQYRMESLDLRKNTKLQSIGYAGSKLLLSENSNWGYVNIRNRNLAPYLDNIIHSVYLSAVAKSHHDGILEFDVLADYDNGDPLGPVSAQSKLELGILQNDYGWTVTQVE